MIDIGGEVRKLLLSEWNQEEENWELIRLFGTYLTIYNQMATYLESLNPASFKIFPNPTSDNIQINFNKKYEQVGFELLDVNGRKLHSQSIKNNETINLEALQEGLYFYYFYTNGKKQAGKLMKR